MNEFYISMLQQYGYPALWLIVFVAAAGAPISGSLLLFAAGAFAALGDLNIFILFPVALSACVLGDNLTYFIGRRVGVALLAWFQKHKRFRWITFDQLEQARTYFKQRTAWAIFLTRFLIVALGGPINLLAGLEQYPYMRFLFWDVSGQILSVLLSLGLGFVFAASWEEVASLFGAFSGFFLALVVTVLLAGVLWRRVRRHKSAPQELEASEVTQTTEATGVELSGDTLPIPLLLNNPKPDMHSFPAD